jgi:N6-adenosine-specific RNA methylase IME4
MDAASITTEASGEFLPPEHPFGGLRRHGYHAIVADPALAFDSWTAIQSANPQSNRDLRRHYRCTSFEEILALPVVDLAAKTGAHLFLWTSPPNLERSLAIMQAWRWKFSSRFLLWIKLRRGFDMHQLRFVLPARDDEHLGLGLTSRKQCEDLLLGRRGNCKRAAKDVRELLFAPVRQHSRKPDEVFARIERYCGPGPGFVELFARTTRPRWDAWGDEVERFSGDAS